MTRPSNKVINIDDSLDQNLSKVKGSKKVNCAYRSSTPFVTGVPVSILLY